MVSKEKAKLYRQRVKTSKCRKVPKPACNAKPTCKYASGKKRQFCRMKSNTRSTGRLSSSRSKSSVRSTSTSGSYPVLKLQELRQNVNPKPLVRLQPVANRQKIAKNEQDLNDWGTSSSTNKPVRMQPVANRRKVNNERGLDDWGSS